MIPLLSRVISERSSAMGSSRRPNRAGAIQVSDYCFSADFTYKSFSVVTVLLQ